MTTRVPRATGNRAVLTAGLVGATLLAAYTGVQLTSGASRTASVLPLVAVCALGLLALALTRFTVFLVAVLAVRSSLDAAKLEGSLDVNRQAGTAPASTWLDPGAILGVLFVCAAVVWLATRPSRTAPARALPVAAAAFVGAGALSLAGSGAPATTAGEVVRLVAAIVMIFVVERVVADDPRRRSLVLGAVLAAAIPPVLMTAYQVLTGTGLADVHGTRRPHGTFWHPNVLGMFCALLLVMAVALAAHARGRTRAVLVVTIAVLGAALVASAARGPWLAALAGLVVVALIQDRRLLPALAACLAGVVLLVPSVMSRIGELSTPYGAADAPESSLAWRFTHWGDALGLVPRNPVTGTGLGTARLQLGREIHNDYLRALVETGVLGLIAYVALFAALALTARRALRATSGRSRSIPRGIAVGFTGCLVTLMVIGVADNVMTSVVVLWYFAAFAGLAMNVAAGDGHPSLPRLERKTRE